MRRIGQIPLKRKKYLKELLGKIIKKD